MEEDSDKEEGENNKAKAEDEAEEAGKQRIVVLFARRISMDKRSRLDIYS